MASGCCFKLKKVYSVNRNHKAKIVQVEPSDEISYNNMSRLTVPVPQFPAIGSQQKTLSGERAKVELKPGRSLIDWIKFTTKEKDLANTGGKTLSVTHEDLEKHNTANDCWLCIRGSVYNVTTYMEYHPGGVEEMLKGAGKDATDLFNDIHRWVNYESMLKKCYVGPLVKEFATPKQSSVITTTSRISLEAPPLPAAPHRLQNKVASLDVNESKPKFNWHQTQDLVKLVVFTKSDDMSKDKVIIDICDTNIFLCTIYVKNKSFIIHYRLLNPVKATCEVDCVSEVVNNDPGKIVISLEKEVPNEIWIDLGTPLDKHGAFMDTKDTEPVYRSCEIQSISRVNHDTNLYAMRLPVGCRMEVPVGHHIYISGNVDGGMVMVRPYTVVIPSLHTTVAVPDGSNTFYLMIKLYPAGALTSHLATLTTGSLVSVSNPAGTFSVSAQVARPGCRRVVMLAAGTGLTPLVRLIHTLLYAPPPATDTATAATVTPHTDTRSVKLVFFNKTEADILWRQQLEEECAKRDNFQVVHVLSGAGSEWRGLTGRVSRELLQEQLGGPGVLGRPADERRLLACVCGPTPFTNTTVQYLEELGLRSSEIHAFT